MKQPITPAKVAACLILGSLAIAAALVVAVVAVVWAPIVGAVVLVARYALRSYHTHRNQPMTVALPAPPVEVLPLAYNPEALPSVTE